MDQFHPNSSCILYDHGYGYSVSGMDFQLSTLPTKYRKSGSVSEFYFFFTIVAARNLWR